MLIESIIKRKDGTKVEMGDEEYHFKDDGKGHHVAEVNNQEHIDRLLSIKEGFFEHGKAQKKEKAKEVVKEDKDALPEDPEKWTNKQTNAWAKEQDLNPFNKQSLLDYADKKGIVGIDENMNPANIIRVIATGLK
jgi:hypothetical protein